ncbi:MAG TPA: hypothetical protein VI452_00290 [Marmoricola sp.]
MRPRAGLGACLVAALLLAGCGGQPPLPRLKGPLLTYSDLPEKPANVTVRTHHLPDAAPSWACLGHEDRLLLQRGWTVQARRFGFHHWAITSALFTRPSGGAAQMLPLLEATVRRCIQRGGRVQDLGIVPARQSPDHRENLTYQSWSPKGWVKGRRGYKVVDDRHLVEITVVGIHDELAPPLVGGLLTRAADRVQQGPHGH